MFVDLSQIIIQQEIVRFWIRLSQGLFLAYSEDGQMFIALFGVIS